MDFHEEKKKEKDSSISISLPKNNLALTLPSPPMYRLINTTNNPTSLEIRLFYVRISPCSTTNLPDHLKILHLRREIGVSLEINGSRIPASDTATLTLRRDRIDKETSEVTYVSTDNLRVTGAIEFEVYEEAEMVLCGTLERVDSVWSNGNADKDSKTGWSMDCYTGAGVTTGSCSFFQPKLGISWPSIEVYVAGCCSGVPLILTKTIQVSPRRKHVRHGVLDAIPEDDETGKENGGGNELVRQRRTTSQFWSGSPILFLVMMTPLSAGWSRYSSSSILKFLPL